MKCILSLIQRKLIDEEVLQVFFLLFTDRQFTNGNHPYSQIFFSIGYCSQTCSKGSSVFLNFPAGFFALDNHEKANKNVL